MSRHREYYGPAHEPRVVPAESKRPKPVIGAEAIAALLEIKTKQVYRLVEGDPRRPRPPEAIPPIERRPGFGLVADRETLLLWWAQFLGAKPT